jgi:PAS domain S-box-containing protein
MSNSNWPQQLEAMRRRVTALYRSAASGPVQHELLPVAFEELQNALEELQAMYEELCLQHEHLLNTREHVEAEFQTYQHLFTHAPIAYLSTGLNGTIRHANCAAAALFHTTERSMIGRSLALFVPDGQRHAFRERMVQLTHSQDPQAWEAQMRSWRGASFQAALTTLTVHGPLGYPTAIRWVVRAVDAAQTTELGLSTEVEPEPLSREVGGSMD